MAAVLNEASGRLAACTCLDDPELGALTVGRAFALLDALLANPNRSRRDCVLVQAVADRLNEGTTLVACPE